MLPWCVPHLNMTSSARRPACSRNTWGLTPQPTFYVETLCSSSSTGVKLAYSLVKSGLHDVVAVIGFQKMSEISSADSQERMGRGADIQWESPFGTMMPAYYAMYARAHMEKIRHHP